MFFRQLATKEATLSYFFGCGSCQTGPWRSIRCWATRTDSLSRQRLRTYGSRASTTRTHAQTTTQASANAGMMGAWREMPAELCEHGVRVCRKLRAPRRSTSPSSRRKTPWRASEKSLRFAARVTLRIVCA